MKVRKSSSSSAPGGPIVERRPLRPTARFPRRVQLAVETAVLVVCAALVVGFYGALVFLVVSVWATKNDVTVRIALTAFSLAWFWPIAHALIWRRARRATVPPVPEDGPVRTDGTPGSSTREIDLTASERARDATPADRLDAGQRGRTASV